MAHKSKAKLMKKVGIFVCVVVVFLAAFYGHTKPAYRHSHHRESHENIKNGCQESASRPSVQEADTKGGLASDKVQQVDGPKQAADNTVSDTSTSQESVTRTESDNEGATVIGSTPH